MSLLEINVCGLKRKLLSIKFIEECKTYDVICMSEIRCDDVDMDMVKTDMDALGFGIIYENIHAFSRYKSGGLLIAIKNDSKLQWKALSFKSDVFSYVQVDKKVLVYKNILLFLLLMFHPAIQGMVRLNISMRYSFLIDFSYDYFHFLCGDFNSFTGISSDYVIPHEGAQDVEENEDYRVHLPDILVDLSEYEIDSTRYSQDVSCDRSTYGKKLLKIL